MNIFLTPAEPFTLFSYCDFAILIGLNLIFYFLIKYNYFKRIKFHKTIIALLFMIVIPILSNMIEIDNVNRINGIVDSFNLLYTFLKIPLWWLIGLVNIFTLRFFLRKIKESNSEFSQQDNETVQMEKD